MRKPAATKELEFLNNIIMPVDPNKCWIFKILETRGYGVIRGHGKIIKAHRFSYEYYVGPIPDGMMICHHCDVRSCVNPKHLFIGTAQDNAQDRENKKRGRDCRGTKSHHAKLNENQVIDIKIKLKNGHTVSKIAKEYGLGRTTIHHIKAGENWKHVTLDGD